MTPVHRARALVILFLPLAGSRVRHAARLRILEHLEFL